MIYDRGGAPTLIVSGLDVHEGRDVWAWADRELVGPLKVSGGAVTLPSPATRVIVGRFPPARGRLPTLREKLQNGEPFRPPARIYELGLSLAGTGQIDIAVNGGPFRNVPLTWPENWPLDIAGSPPRDTTGVASATAAQAMERTIRAVAMIPGSGEFIYGS